MAFDAHKNLAIATVATIGTPATSTPTLSVAAGDGARFPVPPFNATVWPATAIPTPVNAEVVRVTAIAGDAFTITRAQEGTTARSIVPGDLIAATITAKTITDLETAIGAGGGVVPTAGAWTPLLRGDGATSGQVYSVQTASYARLGPVVTVGCQVTLSNKGTTSGNLQVQGLPFAAAPGLFVPSVGGWTLSTPFYYVSGVLVGGTTAIYLRGMSAAGNMAFNMQATELVDGSLVHFSMTYLTNAALTADDTAAGD